MLSCVSKYISDAHLVSLAESLLEERNQTRKDMHVVAKALGPNPVALRTEHEEAAKKQLTLASGAATVEAPKPKFVEPEGEVAARMTEVTRDAVLTRLRIKPATLEEINTYIKGKRENTAKVLKLMWVRKLVLYDNSMYYLA